MPRRQEDLNDATRISRRLGVRLRLMRKQLRWTQDELSERIGLTAEAYARIERGHSLPSFPTLLRVCRVLQTSPDVLLVDGQDEGDGADVVTSNETSEHIAALVYDLRHMDVRVVRDVAQLVRTFRGVVEEPAPARDTK